MGIFGAPEPRRTFGLASLPIVEDVCAKRLATSVAVEHAQKYKHRYWRFIILDRSLRRVTTP
jgi:hypothetical protein